jgi:alpha-L-fucosidase
MMKELFTNYGHIWELWWDGANGEGPNGKKQVYDWKRFETTVRQLSPKTIVFSDIGPDIRWVGNEKGIAGRTNWNLLDTAGFARGIGAPHTDTLNQGNVNGKNWIPAECDVSIRPGWFYHAKEDDKVKTPHQLFDLYLKSVGRGANFLLNVPPDRRGLIHENDSASLVDFKKMVDKSFEVNLASRASIEIVSGGSSRKTGKLTDLLPDSYEQLSPDKNQTVNIKFSEPVEVNCIALGEMIAYGQRVQSFEIVLIATDGSTSIKGTTIGRKRIVSFPTQKISGIALKITQAKTTPIVNEVSVYKIHESLIEN